MQYCCSVIIVPDINFLENSGTCKPARVICAYRLDDLFHYKQSSGTKMKMHNELCFFVIFLLTFYPSKCMNEDHSVRYEKLYELGMEAYKKGNWPECSEFFKSAIEDYHYIKNAIIDCRLKCKKSESESETEENEFSINLQSILKTADCLRRCKLKKLGHRAEAEVPYIMDKKFEDRGPYNFVQFCYFKNEQYKEAAAASYTYYITHQQDEMMIQNLQYYKTLPGVDNEDFVDLERKPYQIQYIRGLTAYNEGNWEEAAAGFEESLSLYYVEEERCRAGCEKFYSHSGYPDFINAIADHYVTVIVCQQKCLKKLSTFGMESLEDFVAEHYNYLQYAYYESNNLEKAFQSIANYLLFKPKDVEMLQNKRYYVKTLRHKETAFKPSQEVIDYVDMWRKIEQNLDYIRDEYILPGEQPQSEESTEDNNEEKVDFRKSADPVKRVQLFEKLGIQLVGEWGSPLNMDRYITDGFIRSDQCEALADIARSRYDEDQSFKTVTIADVTKLIKDEEDYEFSLRLLLKATDVMKAYTSVYFNQTGLVVKDVHVNCRTSVEESDEKLQDDCVLQENGICFTEDTPREEFMLVSYLTEMSDETGEFYFVEDDGTKPTVQPQCGRVVGFKGHLKHGVNLPQKHERCTIVMSFSNDKELLLPDILEARSLLAKLEEKRLTTYRNVDNTEILEQFYDQGVKIVQKGEDLHGAQRFVSDGLSTEQECKDLIELAKHGIQGSGYRGHTSPHTEHEIFSGLEVTRIEKLMKKNIVSPDTLQLFLDISEHSRLLVEKYFNLTQPLYFDYTHLVCRTAIEGDTDSRETDLSHPVHSDNCMIQPDGSCIVDKLAYAQRHYSAIMYLNDDFEGGEFFFAHNNKSEQISLEPKCGRLVAFNAGEYHGVKAVTKGQRCAIAMWYTHHLDYVEVSRIHAQRTLDKWTLDGDIARGPVDEDHDEL